MKSFTTVLRHRRKVTYDRNRCWNSMSLNRSMILRSDLGGVKQWKARDPPNPSVELSIRCVAPMGRVGTLLRT